MSSVETAWCEVCGNDSGIFEVATADGVHAFDSVECAIYGLAVTCARCGTRVIGHGFEANGAIYCSAPCAGLVTG